MALSFSLFQGQRRHGTAVREELHMLDFLHQALTVDTYTIVVVALLSGWAGVLTLHVLSRTVLALVFIPGFVFGALLANYLFEEIGFMPTPDRETNVVIACTLGLIVTLLVLLVIMRLTSAYSHARRPPPALPPGLSCAACRVAPKIILHCNHGRIL
jgi:hypothetical protein